MFNDKDRYRRCKCTHRHKFLKRLTEALFTQVWHLLYEKLKRDISLLLLLICGKLRFKAKKNADNFILIWFIIRLPFAKVNNNDNMVEYFFCCYSSRKKIFLYFWEMEECFQGNILKYKCGIRRQLNHIHLNWRSS